MRYLLGDSTESGLDFNYLAFLRDVIDAAVVLVEADATLGSTEERKRAKEKDAGAIIASIEDLGKRTAHLVAPLVKDPDSPVGRCATAIAIAAKEAIEHESSQVRTALASGLAAIEAENAKLRKRSVEIFDRLLKTHDLPNAEKVYEVAWTSTGLKAAMRQRTTFGIEAVLALDVPSNSLFTSDLRVDKIVDGVEINALEPGGWLKKGDKLVPHKLGRYHITRVVVGADVTVRVRSTAEANASAFEITTDRDGEIRIERLGGTSTAREFSIEDHNQPKLRQLTDKLAAAARALADHRTSVVTVEVDGIALADHKQPRAIAERMVLAIAPTVVKISRHSRNPGELVLRRMIGDDRREEIFVTTAELRKKYDGLPPGARELFAPLQLDEEEPPAHGPMTQSGAIRVRPKTMPPAHPPPPPPPSKHRPPPPPLVGAAQLPGMPPLVIPRDAPEVDDDIVEITPYSSSPAIPIAELDPQPASAPVSAVPAPFDEPKSGRAQRPTQGTVPPPLAADSAAASTADDAADGAPEVIVERVPDDDEATDDANGDAVALDVMKASVDDIIEERAQGDSIPPPTGGPSVIDSAQTDAVSGEVKSKDALDGSSS